MADLLRLEEAQARLLALGAPLAREEVAIGEADGRWLAEDVAALVAQPPCDVSAMDGWAVRAADGADPRHVVGVSAAGAGFRGTIGRGETVRIFTGAPVPTGADAVVLQEDAALEGEWVRIVAVDAVTPGRHIRRAGQDFRANDTLARAGQQLSPARIGLLAAGGHGRLGVRRAPRVAVLATGSELVPPGVVPKPPRIVSSNGAMIAALARRAGARVSDHGIVADDRHATRRALAAAAGGADVLVTIGGASVSAHDLVRPALADLGGRLDFWRIAIRPGKPLLAGRLGDAIVLGLPGNPVSAFVCALLLLCPLLRHLAGAADPMPKERRGRAGAAVEANGARRAFLRARLDEQSGEPLVTPAPVQDSAMLSVLAASDVLLIRPEHAPALSRGAEVAFLTY
jgi:molybdopterin molybdotransferase